MYRNCYQGGMLTVFYSVGSKPLALWDMHIRNGYVTRFLDQDIKSMVLEIGGDNVSTTYITCPKDNKVLGITLPFLVMIVKNLKKYFTFEVTILDETGTRRRFRVSNFQSSTQILPLCTVMPIGLSDGWNQIQFNLAEFTRRAYKKQYVEVQKLKVNANIRLRRIYFTERLLPEDELPAEYKLFFPLSNAPKGKNAIHAKPLDKENIKTSTSQQLTEHPLQPDTKVDSLKSSEISIHSLKKQPSHESKNNVNTEIENTEDIEETMKTADSLDNKGCEGENLVEDIVTETQAVETMETTAAGTETTVLDTVPSESDAIEANPAETYITEPVLVETDATQTPVTEIIEGAVNTVEK
ncbi:cilia- and flagella-associated protein 20-like [Pararge aegeria]|uniref:Jg19051 protein n=1 Tax=Pararge aegeria aegeria TaxID=348720 RepID=A0A8S4RJA8_9NEOP|nr:cilia- and flagella-associated protein 20-like [Pararge aegeria]CAH2236853.1 jg19051 [Pararge aegeria aegeria]